MFNPIAYVFLVLFLHLFLDKIVHNNESSIFSFHHEYIAHDQRLVDLLKQNRKINSCDFKKTRIGTIRFCVYKKYVQNKKMSSRKATSHGLRALNVAKILRAFVCVVPHAAYNANIC